MAPRSTHRKSRNGCDQCKRRRVKCNEQGPPCANCITRELPCTYSGLPNSRRAPAAAAAAAATPPASSAPSQGPVLDPPLQWVPRSETQQPSFSLGDLGLIHQFSTSTYQSLCNDPSDHYAWQIIIPQKALEYGFLLDGVLAVAALHRATITITTTGSDAEAESKNGNEAPAALAYINTALQYHNSAFAPFQLALANITPVNCEAVFAHSIITTVISIALPQLTNLEKSEGKSPSMTENMIIIFELLQGVKRILNISLPWLKTKLFTRRHDFLKDPVSDVDLDNCPCPPGTTTAFIKLSTLNKTLANFDPDQYRINNEAICLLRRCFSRYASSGEPSAVLTWISAVGKDFVSCLRRRQPFPLLILMHWGVLLGELDGLMWWAKGSGRALVMELLVALPPGVFQWDGAQLWPKESFGV